ncbi:MAG: hypothetical protein LBM93_10775 [Oscillospiraceae bacterium]|nr:hypothetical protein [Oscillospiraceae bacterium]
MNIKDGLYVVYNGKEYYSYDKKEYFKLLTSEEEEGFKLCNENEHGKTYRKFILRSEASDCYKINTYAIHEGFNCVILGGKDKEHRDIFFNGPRNEEELKSINVEKALKVVFKVWDRILYRKIDVPIEELEFYEVKSEYDLWAN